MKKTTYYFAASILSLMVLLGTFMVSGCEDGAGTTALVVTPVEVNLTSSSFSNTVTFSVSSNSLRELSLPLAWSVSNPFLGNIASSAGVSASYSRTPGRHGVNVVIVKDQYDAEGLATVRQ